MPTVCWKQGHDWHTDTYDTFSCARCSRRITREQLLHTRYMTKRAREVAEAKREMTTIMKGGRRLVPGNRNRILIRIVKELELVLLRGDSKLDRSSVESARDSLRRAIGEVNYKSTIPAKEEKNADTQ